MAHSIVMPNMGMYTVEGTLVAWLRPVGAEVRLGEPIAEIETEKANFEIQAPVAGILHPVAEVGEKFAIEGILGFILEQGESPPTQPRSAPSSKTSENENIRPSQAAHTDSGEQASSKGEVRASPIARRLATQHAIDLTRVTGRGPGGRIVEADILTEIKKRGAEATPSAHASGWKIRQRIPLAGIRRITTERLREGLVNSIPLTITREVRADALASARRSFSGKTGGILSYDALFIKLFAAGLRECAELNSTILNDDILLLDEMNIGFAVAVPGGVLVPVIRNADSVSLTKVATAVRELSERALSGKLQAGDMSGGTATISNLGGHGVDAFTPVLNPPQSAILGIGRIMERPVVDDGRVVISQTCVLSLTFDHRVADGVPAARLLDFISGLMTDGQYLNALTETT